MEVELVIDNEVLGRFPDNSKPIAFLKHWITDRKTKAVTLLKHWNVFRSGWERDLINVSEEIKQPFFAMMRGIVTPYRKKYGIEAGIDSENINDEDEGEDDIVAIKAVVNRHYATVKFLVVGNPDAYKANGIKISDSRIVTPEEFFHLIETTNYEFVQAFSTDFENM